MMNQNDEKYIFLYVKKKITIVLVLNSYRLRSICLKGVDFSFLTVPQLPTCSCFPFYSAFCLPVPLNCTFLIFLLKKKKKVSAMKYRGLALQIKILVSYSNLKFY